MIAVKMDFACETCSETCPCKQGAPTPTSSTSTRSRFFLVVRSNGRCYQHQTEPDRPRLIHKKALTRMALIVVS